jgi:methionyl-tRNA formyltransferase
MGTPTFAVPALEVIAARFPVSGILVVTQPDRAAGRGRTLQPPPVKLAAERLGLDFMQVQSLRDPHARDRLERFAPDLIVVSAFGLLLPRWVLRLPLRGCVNLHASVLPRFRGASPIAAAIACGDAHTGVCLMEMEAGLDSGPVYVVERVDIKSDDTTESLTQRLAGVGAAVLDTHLALLLEDGITPVPQRGSVIETRKIVKAHGAIDWRQRAVAIERHVRAMWPWPRAWTVGAGDTRVQVHAADVARHGAGVPGTVIGHEGGVLVATGDGSLRLRKVQLAGRAAQPASELVQHPAFTVGARLGYGEGFVAPEPWIVEAGEA